MVLFFYALPSCSAALQYKYPTNAPTRVYPLPQQGARSANMRCSPRTPKNSRSKPTRFYFVEEAIYNSYGRRYL